MQPTLDALRALGGQAGNQDIYEWVVAQLDLPIDIVNILHKPGSSLTEVQYRMMWARDELYAYLLDMDPFRFEGLIKVLLETLGYTNVETTSPTNDKGIDVVANIELGITAVREVVQVKRHRGNIGRGVLDQVRGSLHRFRAVRGTIISTGQFSKGAQDAAFELGAAPITLIDGEKLLDLLMDNEIGVRKVAIQYFEFFPDDLDRFDDDTGELGEPDIVPS